MWIWREASKNVSSALWMAWLGKTFYCHLFWEDLCSFAHGSAWVMWLSCVSDSGKRIIILHCHIFPPSSVSWEATWIYPTPTVFLTFFHCRAAICISFLFHDRPLMGAFSVFHFVPYRCKTWGVFTSNLEEWVCGRKDSACEIIT